MNRFFIKLIFILLLIDFLAGCSQSAPPSELIGGAEAGNPPAPATRAVKGVVSEPDLWVKDEDSVNSCFADKVVAVNTEGEEKMEDVDEQCAFSIGLLPKMAYMFSFEKENEDIASLTFNHDDETYPSSYMYLAEGDEDIDLGLIIFEGDEAFPEYEPSEQNDQDGDGINDNEDPDDDNNGINDADEIDCDLDGLWDLYDNDLESCGESDEPQENEGALDEEGATEPSTEPSVDGSNAGEETSTSTEVATPPESGVPITETSGGTVSDGGTSASDGIDPVQKTGGEEAAPPEVIVYTGYVLEVIPRDGAGTNGTRPAKLYQPVGARMSCAIDYSTVDELTFVVKDDSGTEINCTYVPKKLIQGIACEHWDNLFLPVTVYTATLDGVMCADGGYVEPISWSWKTARLFK